MYVYMYICIYRYTYVTHYKIGLFLCHLRQVPEYNFHIMLETSCIANAPRPT